MDSIDRNVKEVSDLIMQLILDRFTQKFPFMIKRFIQIWKPEWLSTDNLSSPLFA